MTGQFHDFAVDGFPLTGVDDLGARWTVSSADGWFTGADVRTDTTPRSQQSGDWRGRTYRAGRVITLRGQIFCPSATVVEQCGRRLSAVLAAGVTGELAGESAAGTLTAQVQLEDRPLFDPDGLNVAWQLVLGSESHLLYGPEAFGQTTLAATGGGAGWTFPIAFPLDFGVPPGVTPGAVSVANNGTASYFPRLRIDGPVTNPIVTLVETGDWVRFNGTVLAGQHLDINWGVPRRVTIGDNPVSMRHRVTFSGNFLAVPVGGGSVTYSADDADPAAFLSIWSREGVFE